MEGGAIQAEAAARARAEQEARTETARVSLLEAELEVVKSQIGATKKQLGQASQGSDQKTKFNPAFDMDSDSDDSDSEGVSRASAAFPCLPKSCKSGWLWKEGQLNKSMKKRWFVLQRDQGGTCELLYYKAPPESHWELPAGTIRLGTLCKFNRLKNQRKGFPHGMRLDIADPSAKTAKYVIAGSSAAEIQGWVEAVETQLRKGRETAEVDSSSPMELLSEANFMEQFMTAGGSLGEPSAPSTAAGSSEVERTEDARRQLTALRDAHGRAALMSWPLRDIMDALGMEDKEPQRSIMESLACEVLPGYGAGAGAATAAPELDAGMERRIEDCLQRVARKVGASFLLLTVSKICGLLLQLPELRGVDLVPYKKFIRTASAKICSSTFTPEEITSAYNEYQAAQAAKKRAKAAA